MVILKDIIIKKRELEKNSSKWELYVKALDKYFEKYKGDTEKINTITNQVSSVKIKLWNSLKDQEVKLLIDYIVLKAELIHKNNLDVSSSINEESKPLDNPETIVIENDNQEIPSEHKAKNILDCWTVPKLDFIEQNDENYIGSIESLQCLGTSMITCTNAKWRIWINDFTIEKNWDTCAINILTYEKIYKCSLIDDLPELSHNETAAFPIAINSDIITDTWKYSICEDTTSKIIPGQSAVDILQTIKWLYKTNWVAIYVLADRIGDVMIEQADFKTFEVISYWIFAKDKNYVYFREKILEWVDPITFELIEENMYTPIFKDKSHTYTYDSNGLEIID